MLKTLEIKDTLRKHYNELNRLLTGTEYEEKYKKFMYDYNSISDSDKIRLVVVGDVSTGKSTIIKALTGIEDIGIGTDVKTDEAKAYEYKDIYIVDTPGLNSRHADHTDKTNKALLNSDRIIYCITENALFSDQSIDDFVNICHMTNTDIPIVLAITKFGSEWNDDENPGERLNKVTVQIEDDLKEKNIFSGQYELCILNAERYIDGVRSGNDDLIMASYFDYFLDVIEKPLSGGTDLLIISKCNHQAKFIQKFTTDLIGEIKKTLTDEEERRIYEAKQSKLEKLKTKQKELKNKVKAGVNDVLDTLNSLLKNTDINETADICSEIENMLGELLDEIADDINEETDKSRSDEKDNVFTDTKIHIEIDAAPEKKKSVFFKIFRKPKEKDGKGFFEKVGTFGKDAINDASEMARPVKIGKKRHLFKKSEDIMSEVGGEGTELAKLMSRFPKHGGNMAKSIGKISQRMAKIAKYAPYIGLALDTTIDIADAVNENMSEQKRLKYQEEVKKSIIRQIKDLKQNLFSAIDEYFNNKIDDVDNNVYNSQNTKSRLISSLMAVNREIENIIYNINNMQTEDQL